jgi:hypothetical protein
MDMKNILKNTRVILLTLSGLAFSATSCDDFLNINTDPNNPLTARLDQVLPSVETVIFEAFGNGSGGMSNTTSQFVHHTVQRGNSNFYFVAGNEFDFSNAWPNLYAGALKDIDGMINLAEERESYHYLGVAQVLKAYTYSMMIDLWGKAAYTEFGQGTENPFPIYDEGEDIYPLLFTLLDDAIANFNAEVAEGPQEDSDLIYAGDIEKWQRLAGSIKLKLYNQVNLTTMYNATAVASLIGTDSVMESGSDGFRLMYGSSNNPENRHPLFKQDYVDANANYIDPYFFLIMSGDFAGYGQPVMNPLMEGIQDPRIPFYFYNQISDANGDDPQNPTTSAHFDDFLSIWFASFNIDPNEGFDQAQSQTVVGEYPAGGAYDDASGTTAGVADGQNPGLGGVSYTRLYPYHAHLFTLAELALVKGAPGDPRVYFEDAMNAAFDEVNELSVDFCDGGTYINDVMALWDAASPAGQLELLITQKWIASFGASMDAYTDYRRTGYPLMFDPATDGNPFTILNRAYPVSFPYFIDDLQINPNAPAQREPATDKVFWDVN